MSLCLTHAAFPEGISKGCPETTSTAEPPWFQDFKVPEAEDICSSESSCQSAVEGLSAPESMYTLLGKGYDGFAPRIALGKRLRALREKIVESGVKLLDWDEIKEEVRKRRGGIESVKGV